jgi:small GTP-binding protein
VIDDPVVVRLSDDRADINLHGGPWVVQATLDLLARDGFTIVMGDDALNDPAAFDSADEIESEMLAALPLAKTEEAVAMLIDQPRLWREFFASPRSRDEIDAIVNDRSLRWMLHPPRVAIIGLPNVGKSTLANQLFGQTRSITADVPGTTRDWVGEIANIDGLPVMLLDTPGIRETSDGIERASIARAGDQIVSADLVMIVLDLTHAFDEQRALIERHPNAMRIANKSDLPAIWNPSAVSAVAVSARQGAGIDALRRAIRSRFIADRDLAPRWWTQRHRESLARTLAS